MVSQPACPFIYASGEETSLLREETGKKREKNTKRVKTVCKRAESEFCS